MTLATPSEAPTATPTLAARPSRAVARRGVTARQLLGLSLLLGAVVRAVPALRSDFPPGDGGLFYLMIEAVRQHGYALPATVLYNGVALPFAYPPLGFYVAAAVEDLTRWPTLDVMRFLPLLFSGLTLLAFAALARDVLRDDAPVLAAVVAFALLPLTYRWFVMGAGVTRAPGLLFGILTAQQALRLFTRGERRYVVTTALALALTALSHPNATVFAGASLLVLWLLAGRTRAGLRRGALAGGLALALTAPWWGSVVAQHGLTPFLSAPQNGNPGPPGWLLLLTFAFTQEPLLPLLAFAGLFGLVVSVFDRRWLLPVWLVVACVLDTRYTCTYGMAPLALLVGHGAARWAPLVAAGTRLFPATNPWHGRVARFALGWAVLYSFASTVALPGPALQSLGAEHQTAMAWVAANTPADSRFLVIAPEGNAAGSESEWFPVLAARVSVGAYQGLEWLPKPPGPSPWERYDRLQQCGASDVACLDDWAADGGITYSHIYLRRTGTRPLQQALLTSGAYRLLHRSDDVLIFGRTAAVRAAAP